MRQRGEYRVPAGSDAVWLALRDPEVLSQCIDGCQSITRTGDDAFSVTVKRSVGALTGVFTAEVKLADLDPPYAYALEVTVKRGGAGSGAGSATISLAEEGNETLLRYDLEGQVGGKLAQVDERLIDADARRMADAFFARFSELVGQGQAALARTPPDQATTPAPRNAVALVSILLGALVIAGLFALVRRRGPRGDVSLRASRP